MASLRDELLPTATHFVFPDLPQVYSPQDRKNYLISTAPKRQIQTVALSRHKSWKSLVANPIVQAASPDSKLLLVGGNDKGPETLSTIQAAKILRNELDAELWGVANPNDLGSVESIHAKREAGIQGFLTQPLLCSTALETLQAYPSKDTTLVVGMAMPQTAKALQFWSQLVVVGETEQAAMAQDPLFQSHLAFFSQPYFTSIAWIGRELQHLATHTEPNHIHGIHFMPLKNTDDLRTIFKSLAKARS